MNRINKRTNTKRRGYRNRRGVRRVRQSEGLPRRASTSIVIQSTISGATGISFTVDQLLNKYFSDPRLVRIYGFRFRINILDIGQPFLQYQALVMMDNIGGPLVCMTQPRQITIDTSIQSVSIARDRSFWIEAQETTNNFLDLRFQSYVSTKIVIEITTFFNIEQDIINPLNFVNIPSRSLVDENLEFETLSISNSNNINTNNTRPQQNRGRRA